MDKTVLVVHVTLSTLFLIAGVIVVLASDVTVGVGLIGTATGLALSTGTPALAHTVSRMTGGTNGEH